MKFVEPRPFADPDAAAYKLVEIASTIEPVPARFTPFRSRWRPLTACCFGFYPQRCCLRGDFAWMAWEKQIMGKVANCHLRQCLPYSLGRPACDRVQGGIDHSFSWAGIQAMERIRCTNTRGVG